MDYTDLPSGKELIDNLIEYLGYKGKSSLGNLFKNPSFEYKIWYSDDYDWGRNKYRASFEFYVPINQLNITEKELESNKADFILCFNALLSKYNCCIVDYSVNPKISKSNNEKSLTQNIDDTLAELPRGLSQMILPLDIKQKGREMEEVYIYLYYVENSLRFFVEDICKDAYGDNYFEKINLPKIKKRIEGRKNEEKKKEYMPFRGASDIFYLDFVDLSSIISEEWKLFESYFPELPWITSKIKELAEIRNYIAHNSYIEKHQIDILKTYYTMILKQLEKKYS